MIMCSIEQLVKSFNVNFKGKPILVFEDPELDKVIISSFNPRGIAFDTLGGMHCATS